MRHEPRLLKKYKEEVAPKLHTQFSYKSVMQIPKLTNGIANAALSPA